LLDDWRSHTSERIEFSRRTTDLRTQRVHTRGRARHI
jgi:hypothetical protein